MSRAGLAIAGLLVLVAACGPFHQLPIAESTPRAVIPWLPLPADVAPIPVPSPQAAPVPAGTPACTAQDLAGGEDGSQGATGHVITFLAFAGTGSGDCFVDGTPSVTAIDKAGRAIPFQQRAPFFPPLITGPQLISPGPVPQPQTSLKYGQAGFQIDWDSQPEACPGQTGVTVAGVRVDIPGGGTLTLSLPAAPEAYVCQGLGVGNFESPPLPADQAPLPPVPTAAIGILGGAFPGKNFEYLVTLTNYTKAPIDFAITCPNYEEEFFADIVHGSPPLGGKHFYKLNCAPAGTLAPGASEIFQMIFKVPTDARPGSYTLVFAMGYGNGTTTSAQKAVVVLASA